MFAQLLGAAKRAISRTPSYQGTSSDTREEVPEIPTSEPALTDTTDTITMVTTRRGTETPGMAATPASSAKKAVGKRELEALDTPTQVKRQRKTTVELKRNLRSTPRKGGEAASAESTQESVDENGATPRPEKESSPLAIRRRSSPKVVVEPSSPVKEDAPTQENAFHTPEPASSEAAFVTPYTSKKALEGSPTPKATKTTTPASAKKARGRPKKAQKDDIPEEIPSSTQESSIASPTNAPPKAHVRFGSEEPTVNAKGHTRYEAPTPAPAAAGEEDEDSGDDSDEAPEMVSTSAAASKAAAAQADTTRALAAQQEAERKKRSAREKRMAEEQAAKRERDAIKAQKAAAKAAKAARLSSVAEVDEVSTPMDIDRATLPSLLPDSLLANLGDVRPPTPPPEARGKTEEELRREKLAHHIKFLESSSKAPKDKRVGKHHVAVLGQQNRVLPPKVSKNTKGVREAWLKGRQGQQTKGKPRIGKTSRQKFGGGGFLCGED